MKNNNIKAFLTNHRQRIPEGDFVRTLWNKLAYYPQPACTERRLWIADMLPLLSMAVALLLITLFDGWRGLLAIANGAEFYGINVVHIAICVAMSAALALISLLSVRDVEMVQ
jgi:hypothetical protein